MAKKPRNTKMYMALFIVAVMILSAFGFILGYQQPDRTQGAEEQTFGDYTFYNIGSFWQTEIDGKEYFFTELPQNITNISIDESFDKVEGIYFIDDTKNNLSVSESQQLMADFLNRLNIRIQLACYDEEKCDADLPIVKCDKDDSTIFNRFDILLFKKGNETKVYRDDKCIVLQADDEMELARAVDVVKYKFLGVI